MRTSILSFIPGDYDATIDNLRMELADLQQQTEDHLATIRKLREENAELVTRICMLEATLEENL